MGNIPSGFVLGYYKIPNRYSCILKITGFANYNNHNTVTITLSNGHIATQYKDFLESYVIIESSESEFLLESIK